MANLKRLDKLLRADAYVYQSLADPRYVYCRIEIHRIGDDVLPVLAKDVLFVQDASASITEQKLHFCREGLLKALAQLGPDDRFNVVEFRDKASQCFKDWALVNPDTLTRAREFIGAMKSEGNTDIFGSLKELLDVTRQPGRPVIVQVLSDGVATVGLTDRSRIIEAFSQENRGAVSVFALGTYPGANAYLLDLLSARNRGDSTIVRTGRWDIPTVVETRVREVARPVLNDVRFRFSGPAAAETLPKLTSNLYLDKPLVLFARFPRDMRRLVFQATGQAGDISCDMVFDIDLTKAAGGDREIRTQWAWQKIYDLIGEHHRTQDASVFTQMQAIAAAYGIRVPYRDELKP
jgi:Ca-activated chloride channel family protein